MTWATMYDAIHANVARVPANAEIVAGYVTGTLDINWTNADFRRFATSRKVTIDQGGIGSPVPEAMVRDVETGAWTPEAAVRGPAQWTAVRPTIYCNQSTLSRVLAAGWKGDIWLVHLSQNPPTKAPDVPNCTVVAVQYAFKGIYDQSIVFDPYWPDRRPQVIGIQFGPPNVLRQTADVSLAWEAIGPVGGKAPTGYTVSFVGMDDREYYHAVTGVPNVTATGLERGWTYQVHVWANGGDTAPPHATLIIHT